MTPSVDLIKVLIVAVIMISACISDWRKREASEMHWALMGGAGMVLVALYGGGETWARFMVVSSMALMLFDLLVDRDVGAGEQLMIYAAIAVLFLIPAVMSDWDLKMIAIPILATYAVMILLYYFGLMKGGADVTCLIAMGMVFQHYPVLNGMPLIEPGTGIYDAVFLFPLFVLMTALIMTAVVMPIYFFVRNLRRGDTGTAMFFGYRIDLGDVPGSMVWPIQDIINGELVTVWNAVDDPDVLQRLWDAGAERIWVTPKIPFLIPIFAGFLFMVTIGNPLFIL